MIWKKQGTNKKNCRSGEGERADSGERQGPFKLKVLDIGTGMMNGLELSRYYMSNFSKYLLNLNL